MIAHSEGGITVAVDNGLARDVENNIEISVPIQWFGVQRLKLRLDNGGIMIVGLSVDENFGKEHVVGTQYRSYSSLIEHEVLNYWNRF